MIDWQRMLAPFRAFGFWAGFLYCCHRLLQRVSPRAGIFAYEFVSQPIVEKAILPAALSRNLRFELLTAGHPDLVHMPTPEDVVAARFRSGAHCLAAYRRGSLLGYAWWCTPSYFEEEARCTFELVDPGATVFDFDLYVLPAERMGLAFMAIWHGVNDCLRSQGVAHTCSRISRFNEASRRAHARLGAVVVGRGWFLRLGAMVLAVSSLAPYVGVSFGRSRHAKFRLPASN